MPVEASHIQLLEYKKEVIPYINWMMEDLFCRYGVSIPYFLLEFDFPDYLYKPAFIDTNGYQFGINWGSWGYYLPWFNELLGLAFDVAGLPRWQIEPWDMPPFEMSDWKFPTWQIPPGELPEWPERKRIRLPLKPPDWTIAGTLSARLGIEIPASIELSYPDWTVKLELEAKLGLGIELPISVKPLFPERTIQDKISAQLGIEAPMFTEPSISPQVLAMLNERISALYENAVEPPDANFTSDVTSGDIPFTVVFTDTSTNSPTSWLWDFGDDETSTDQNPEHEYDAGGTYTVSLTATNVGGSDTETKTDYIVVYYEIICEEGDNRLYKDSGGVSGGTYQDAIDRYENSPRYIVQNLRNTEVFNGSISNPPHWNAYNVHFNSVYLTFDTSVLSGKTLSSATLRVHIYHGYYGCEITGLAQSICLFQHSYGTLDSGDWSGGTLISTTSVDEMTNNAYNEFDIPINLINQSGNTQFRFHSALDNAGGYPPEPQDPCEMYRYYFYVQTGHINNTDKGQLIVECT